MSNIFGNFPVIKSALNWFKDYYNSPEGKRVIILIACSLAFGFYSKNIGYDKGISFQKKEDSLTIDRFEKQIVKHEKAYFALKVENDAQQKKLEDRDCTDEVMKYRTLFQNLKTETTQSAEIVIAQKNKEVEERKNAETILKADQKKTKDLIKIKNTLK